jgi:hypothetical protein
MGWFYWNGSMKLKIEVALVFNMSAADPYDYTEVELNELIASEACTTFGDVPAVENMFAYTQDELAKVSSFVSTVGVAGRAVDVTFGLNRLILDQDVLDGKKNCNFHEFEALKVELLKLNPSQRAIFIEHTKAIDAPLKEKMVEEIDALTTASSSVVNDFHDIEVSDEFVDGLSDITSPGSAVSEVDDYSFGLNYLFKEQDVMSGLKNCSLNEFEALKTELMKLPRAHRILFLHHTKVMGDEMKEKMMSEIDEWFNDEGELNELLNQK